MLYIVASTVTYAVDYTDNCILLLCTQPRTSRFKEASQPRTFC
jgi:hypothetical protein